MNIHLKKIIEKNTISSKEFSKDFTVEQKKVVESEIKFYDIVMALKITRQKLGLTQEQLAQKANIPRTTITKVESGNYNPTLQTLMSIAAAMNKKLQISLL